jgi:hypothetical protein
MRETTREWIRRHIEPIGTVLALIVLLLLSPYVSRGNLKVVIAVGAVLISAIAAWVGTPLTPLKSAGIPGLPIGEHFRRTSAYFHRIGVPVLVAWILAVTLFVTDIPKLRQLALLFGGVMVLVSIEFLFLRNQLRCPRCGAEFTRGAADVWTCSRCGVSFNDPWP